MTETPTPSDRLASVCRALDQDVAELAQLARRQHDLRQDIELTRIHVEDIRNSRTWRVLEMYRKARDPRRPERSEPDGGAGRRFDAGVYTGRCQRRCAKVHPASTSLDISMRKAEWERPHGRAFDLCRPPGSRSR